MVGTSSFATFHRITEVGKTTKFIWPNHWLTALLMMSLSATSMFLEHLQGQWLPWLPPWLILIAHYSLGEEIFPTIQADPPRCSLRPFPLVLSLLPERRGQLPPCLSLLSYNCRVIRSPLMTYLRSPFPNWTIPVPSPALCDTCTPDLSLFFFLSFSGYVGNPIQQVFQCMLTDGQLQQNLERLCHYEFLLLQQKLQVLRKDDKRAFKMATSLHTPFFEWHLVTHWAFAILLSKWMVVCGKYIS